MHWLAIDRECRHNRPLRWALAVRLFDLDRLRSRSRARISIVDLTQMLVAADVTEALNPIGACARLRYGNRWKEKSGSVGYSS